MEYSVITTEDYDELFALWKSISGMGMRSLDDSREGIERFLKRNPNTCFAARENGQIIGSVLCGHDGRRGYIYHTCVHESRRGNGIGKTLVKLACEALKAEGINKCALVCFAENESGNAFWSAEKWEKREDLNYYNLSLNDNNI